MTLAQLHTRVLETPTAAAVFVARERLTAVLEVFSDGTRHHPSRVHYPNGSVVQVWSAGSSSHVLWGHSLDVALVLDPVSADVLEELGMRLLRNRGTLHIPADPWRQ